MKWDLTCILVRTKSEYPRVWSSDNPLSWPICRKQFYNYILEAALLCMYNFHSEVHFLVFWLKTRTVSTFNLNPDDKKLIDTSWASLTKKLICRIVTFLRVGIHETSSLTELCDSISVYYRIIVIIQNLDIL